MHTQLFIIIIIILNQAKKKSSLTFEAWKLLQKLSQKALKFKAYLVRVNSRSH